MDIEVGPGVGQISRDEVRRRFLIQVNVRGRDLASFVEDAQKAVEEQIDLPAGYRVAWGGQFKNLQEATTCGILALWIRDIPFSVSAGVGFIALFGIAVMNGVVLIEHVRGLRNRGESVQEAAYHGALDRLRPVLMTTTTDALRFIPMAVSTSAGAEVQRPLATVVIGGVITSSLLT